MLYSDMSKEQLRAEMKDLQEKGQRAYDAENWPEYEIHMTKWYLAKSYEIRDDARIEIGRTYRIAEEYDRLTVTALEGVMAWGIRQSTGETTAVPIAQLDDTDDDFN
ncbi:YfhH family protein [Alicyclobacillus acidiphilus]|uniref:YfhH family protein n=1 Tax=Alicyclobacillus acidiphilus TaxID=182455 RepID=UPI00082B7581|nr:YfhH family protein [Alicyclobacillus acidiphilus]